MLTLQPVGKLNKQAFTIIELIVVVAISALLAIAAVPGYQNFVQNNASLSIASRLAGSLRLARTEAIKQGIPVTVCPISNTFNPSAAFNESIEEWPCQSTTTWDAWKVFADPNFDATEDFSDGWPILQYVKNSQNGVMTSSISGPITFDPMGFASVSPASTNSSWNWSSTYSSGEWQYSNEFDSAYAGSVSRTFTISPPGCTGNNGRVITIRQNGLITVEKSAC